VLPPLPKANLLVPDVVRLANAVGNWRTKHFTFHRMGNVVLSHKNFHVGDVQIKSGQRGRITHVTPEVSVDILFDGSTKVIQIPKKDMGNFDLQVVTHEVELIDALGQRTGKYSACMVVKDHEDGFYDILCQDGRQKEFVHTSYMRELSTAMYTDVGYLSSRSSGGLSESQCTIADQKLGCSLRSGESSGSSGFELPPEGFIGGARKKGGFAVGSALSLVRCRSETSVNRVEEPCREDVLNHLSRSSTDFNPAEHPGASVCPFMEIQEGGLRCFLALSNFTVSDVVVDIGCGHGKILNAILENHPCQGIGVEVNPSIARIAEHKLRKFGGRAIVVADDIRNVDLQDATTTVSYLLSHSFDTNGGALKEHLSKSLPSGCVVLNYTYPVLGWNGSLQNGVWKYIIGEHLIGH